MVLYHSALTLWFNRPITRERWRGRSSTAAGWGLVMAFAVLLLSLEKMGSLFFIVRFFLSEVHEEVLLPPLPVDEGTEEDSVSVGFPLELGFTEPVELGDGESEEGSEEGSTDEEPPAASFTTAGPGKEYLALAS